MDNECFNCGAKIAPEASKCKYCNSVNPHYKEKSQNYIDEAIKTTIGKHKFNVALFIFLIIFCWPVAVIYLLVTANRGR